MTRISLDNSQQRYILQIILRIIANKSKRRRKEMAKKYNNLNSAEVVLSREDFKGKLNIKPQGGMLGIKEYLNFLHELEIIWPGHLSLRGDYTLFDCFSRTNIRYSPHTEKISFETLFNPTHVANLLKELDLLNKGFIIRTKYINLNTQDGTVIIKDVDGTIIQDKRKRLKVGSANFLILKELLESKKISLDRIGSLGLKTAHEKKINKLREFLGINLQLDFATEKRYKKSDFNFDIFKKGDQYILKETLN